MQVTFAAGRSFAQGERSIAELRAEAPTDSAQLTLLGSLGMGKDVELRTATSTYYINLANYS